LVGQSNDNHDVCDGIGAVQLAHVLFGWVASVTVAPVAVIMVVGLSLQKCRHKRAGGKKEERALLRW
jgi:hypothetical protein